MSKAAAKMETKERPIIFGGESVRAILAGLKTQTRRVVKPQPERVGDGWLYAGDFYGSDDSLLSHLFHDVYGGDKGMLYGGVYGDGTSDRLWVREVWTWYAFRNQPKRVVYRADEELHGAKWRSPIFLPRDLSRLTLELTEVRVERLQSISEEDAKAEGAPMMARVHRFDPVFGTSIGPRVHPTGSHKYGFAVGWDRLNAKRGYSWESNPFVWVLSFKRI